MTEIKKRRGRPRIYPEGYQYVTSGRVMSEVYVFGNALREWLGLDPLYHQRRKPKAVQP